MNPVGEKVDVKPAQRPTADVLEGRFGKLEKLDALRHAADLWAAFKDDDTLWDYMGYGPFAEPRAFEEWLMERAPLTDPLAYAVVDANGKANGVVTYLNIRQTDRSIEIGHIVYAPALQRTPLATELQYLMMRYAFETLGYRRYEWKCDALNKRSRAGAERLGFTFEGIFRQDRIVKGRNRDTAWYSIIDGEWLTLRARFETWLAADNFDAQGKQKTKLAS